MTRGDVERPEHHSGETVGKATESAELGAEREPLVDRFQDRLAHQVLHDVVRRFETLRLHGVRGGTLRC